MRIPKEMTKKPAQAIQCVLFEDELYQYRIYCTNIYPKEHRAVRDLLRSRLLFVGLSFADKDLRIIGKQGNFDYSYNGQISVDEGNQIIVGQHLTPNANDKQEVEPALEEIKEITGD